MSFALARDSCSCRLGPSSEEFYPELLRNFFLPPEVFLRGQILDLGAVPSLFLVSFCPVHQHQTQWRGGTEKLK